MACDVVVQKGDNVIGVVAVVVVVGVVLVVVGVVEGMVACVVGGGTGSLVVVAVEAGGNGQGGFA